MEIKMEVGFFTMPIHPINKDYKKTLSLFGESK